MTAYSNFCLQVVLVYLHPFRHNSLSNCALQPKIEKNPQKSLFGGFKVV